MNGKDKILLTALLLHCMALWGCTPKINASAAASPQGSARLKLVRNDRPLLKLLLPEQSASQQGIIILFPETVNGTSELTGHPEELYNVSDSNDQHRTVPVWKFGKNMLHYTTTFNGNIEMAAKASVESDGLRLSYFITNNSGITYKNFRAGTCIKMHDPFSDSLLERTYVHHPGGFELLVEKPALSGGEEQPREYAVSYGVHRSDTITGETTRFHKSLPADKPFIATVSGDGRWIAAVYAKEAICLWVNPERNGLHTEPAADLPAGATIYFEIKIFIVRGSLDLLLNRVDNEMQK